MIGFIEGTLMRKDEDHILLLAHHVGYEILLAHFIVSLFHFSYNACQCPKTNTGAGQRAL